MWVWGDVLGRDIDACDFIQYWPPSVKYNRPHAKLVHTIVDRDDSWMDDAIDKFRAFANDVMIFRRHHPRWFDLWKIGRSDEKVRRVVEGNVAMDTPMPLGQDASYLL